MEKDGRVGLSLFSLGGLDVEFSSFGVKVKKAAGGAKVELCKLY